MALSLSNFLVSALVASSVWLGQAAAREYEFNITWVRANPDGLADRPVMGINGQWPLPLLNFTVGENVVINMNNQLGNQSTSLHFHGMYQNGTNAMDGPVGVTQCDVPPGHSLTYNFTIRSNQVGTYWYHSHSRAQYPDGFRGQYIIHDPQNPYRAQFDEEIAFTLSDWYSDEMPTLVPQFISYENPTGAEPVPNSALMNDTQNLAVPVQPGKTYYVRISNIGAFAGQYFWIEGHNMTIIETDGVYTEPAEASMIYLAAAQRYGVLVTTRNDTSANFPMMGSMDTDLFDVVPDDLNWNVTGWLVYDQSKPLPAAAEIDEWTDYDDFTLSAQDGLALFDKVDYSLSLDLTMQDLGDGANYAFFNDISYVTPKVPTLYTAMSVGANNTDVRVYGRDTNAFVLNKGDVVEIVMNNDDSGKHPFHLHGNNFQVVVRSDDQWGHYDPNNHTDFPAVPMRRDTVMVRPQGNFVIRFRADNPGVWLFHCHIIWHQMTGLVATMIVDPTTLLANQSIPQQHIDVCKAAGTPYLGNAAGNTVDVLDLSGENQSVAPLPVGFTARGVVALVFSCLSAFLGMAAIAWYGVAPLSPRELARTRRFVEKAGVSTAPS